MENENMNKWQKLSAVQGELKAPKSQRNNFGGYNYRSCEDILEALKPIQSKYGATTILSDEIEQKGDRFYVKATATFIDVETGDSISVSAEAREEEIKKGMDASQITGSASSYARKYALNGLFDIDDTKDADAMNSQDTADKQPTATAKQVERIKTLGCNIDNILKRFKVDRLEQLTSQQASFIISTKENERQ